MGAEQEAVRGRGVGGGGNPQDASAKKASFIQVYVLRSPCWSASSASLRSNFANQSPLAGKMLESTACTETGEVRHGEGFWVRECEGLGPYLC